MVDRLLRAQVKDLALEKRCTNQRRDNRASSNPLTTRSTLAVHPVRQQTGPGDQIAPSSPRSTKRINHISELKVVK